jgi:2,4-dienoyl-CoA reductase (NADPH2)
MASLVKDLQMEELLALVRHYTIQLKKAGVEIQTRRAVDSTIISDIKPDALVIGTGPVYDRLSIPGSERKDVKSNGAFKKQLNLYLKLFSPPILEKLTRIWMPMGKRIVVIGGSIQGCELAEFLVKRKRKVTIVHTGDVLAEGIPVEDQLRLFPWFDRRGVVRYTGVRYEKITDDGLTVITRDGEKKTLKADTYIVAIPVLPDIQSVNRLSGLVKDTYAVGSCVDGGLIVDAIHSGARVGYISLEQKRYPHTEPVAAGLQLSASTSQ